MLVKDKALVLKKMPYKNGFILEVFTRNEGKISFIVYQRKSKNIPVQHVFPMDLMEVEYSSKPKGGLYTFSSFSIQKKQMELDIVRNCVLTFVAEFVKNITYPQTSETEYFDFLEKIIDLINGEDNDNILAYVSIYLVYKTGDFFGIPIYLIENEDFTISKSVVPNDQASRVVINSEMVNFLMNLESCFFGDKKTWSISRKDRVLVLKMLVDYYRIQVEYFKELKSLDILSEVLNS